MLIEDHEFKFESTTELPNEDSVFWYHDYFEIESVKLNATDGGYRAEFVVAEPHYIPEPHEDDDYAPEGWKPQTVTFVQAEPVPYEVAEQVEASLVWNKHNDSLYTPEIEDGKATYTFCIQF
jgi:hypothetical protein